MCIIEGGDPLKVLSLRDVHGLHGAFSSPRGQAPEDDLTLAEVKKGNFIPSETGSRALQDIVSHEGHAVVDTNGCNSRVLAVVQF